MGFRKFWRFDCKIIKESGSALNHSGLYVFVLNRKTPRLIGKTDIIYIGESTSISRRMGNYCRAYEAAPQDMRIHNDLEKIQTRTRIGRILRISISWAFVEAMSAALNEARETRLY